MASSRRRFGFVLAVAAGFPAPASWADDKPEIRWEYRVATKDEIRELGKKDFAAGLNKLGHEGWELVVVDGGYIFKRPRLPHDKEIAELKLSLTVLMREREQQVERLAWSERMLKKGFMSESQVDAERALLERYNLVLDKKRKELESLTPPPGEPAPMAPAPKESKSQK